MSLILKTKQKISSKLLVSVAVVVAGGVLLAAAGFFLVKNARVKPTTPPPSVEIITQQLRQTLQQYQQASASTKVKALPGLKAFIAQRKQLLLERARNSPAAVLSNSADFISSVPDELKGFVEQSATLAGTFSVFFEDDFRAGIARRRYYIETKDHQSFEVVSDKTPTFLDQSQIEASGVLIDQTLVSIASQQRLVSAPEKADERITVTGDRKLGIIMINFLDNPTEPYTVATLRTKYFTGVDSVRAFYQENSFQQVFLRGAMNIDGDFFGWFTINANKSPCNANTWRTAAIAAATASGQGFNEENYDEIGIIFPPTSACYYAGIAGNHTFWLNDSSIISVSSHELGHLFGIFSEGSSRTCTNGVGGPRVIISDTCTRSNYGDLFTVMGRYPNTRHHHAPDKAQLEWYPSDAALDVTQSGRYTITPNEFQSTVSGPKVLRIARYRSSGYFDDYALEFRQPFGQYDDFAPTDPVVNGVSVRLNHDLLDGHPATSSFTDASLLSGESIDELASQGIKMTVVSVAPTGATVDIELACIRRNPKYTVWTIPTARAGDRQKFQVDVVNNDSVGCQSSTFTLTPTLPGAGWVQDPIAPFPLAPSKATTLDVYVTSPASATDGFYSIIETLAYTGSSSYTETKTVQYVIDSAPPLVSVSGITDGMALKPVGTRLIQVEASDANRISWIKVQVNGTDVAVCRPESYSGTCSYSWPLDGLVEGATYVVRVIACDYAGVMQNVYANILIDGIVPTVPSNLHQSDPIIMGLAEPAPHVVNGITVAGIRIASEEVTPPDNGSGGGIQGRHVPLVWDASTDTGSGVAGYKLYFCYASTFNCTPNYVVDVKNVTAYTFSAGVLSQHYVFEVSAYDYAGNESGRSNQVKVDL